MPEIQPETNLGYCFDCKTSCSPGQLCNCCVWLADYLAEQEREERESGS